MDYRKTINLPETELPMRARLPEREPIWQKQWRTMDLYGQLRQKRKNRKKFILHDGPPYANGNIHIGTALNKVLKDFIVRYASMRGYDAPFVPGWDTHGLPIELKALQELKADRHAIPAVQLREYCEQFARKFIDIMTEQFQRLGVLADWDKPYITLNPEYEARQIEVFGSMAEKGYIYKGLKSVYWCPECETALAEAEIEYAEKQSDSIHVAFDVVDGKQLLPLNTKAVIWTTTPWTIPANVAIAVHPDVEYVLLSGEAGHLLVAETLAEQLAETFGLERVEKSGGWRGRELEGIVARHPLFDRNSPIVCADYVTTDDGTGLVHIAPGHGQEDFEVGQKYDLPVIMPVDDRGVFTEEAGPFAGLYYAKANRSIIKALNENGALLAADQVRHQYAHCWRCKQPVIYRATEQWFASVDGFREQALAAVDEVRWIPSWGRTRIYNMVEARADWCISRQRVWGVPIPAFYCLDCHDVLITNESIRAVADLFRREGSNAWYTHEATDILPAGTRCPNCGHDQFRKETDIMDVWFDSGSSHVAVLEEHPDLNWPADMYLEGSDQHRGWFQSSLLTAVATRGSAPYRSVLTHGFVVDGEGRKMSKSLGNVVVPEDVIKDYGADILRLWVASTDYTGDVRVSPEILRQLAEVYRKIRNTLRYLLGNLADFDPARDAIEYNELQELDRWALYTTGKMLKRVQRSFDEYQYHIVYHTIHNYCVNDMSSFYLDVLKDRLYTEGRNSKERRSAQTVLWEIASVLVRIIAPILPHTAEEVWGLMPRKSGDPESVHLTDWPQPPTEWNDEQLGQRWEDVLRVRDALSKALEQERKEHRIQGSLQAEVQLFLPEQLRQVLVSLTEPLEQLFLVASVELLDEVAEDMQEVGASIWVRITPTEVEKCERCWRHDKTVGRHDDHPTLCSRCHGVIQRDFVQ